MTVTVSPNPAKVITTFNFAGLSPAVTGTVNEGAKTIALTVPYGTAVTALVPTITITGASVSPASGVAGNFTTPQTYTVTAADSSTQEYVVTVTITSPNTDATLSNFVISQGTLTPTFTSGTTSYTASVANGVTSITVSPTVNQENATVKVNNVTVASGSPSSSISLNVGSNTISIVVTAQDNLTTDTYTITITRAENTETPAPTIIASGGNANQVFVNQPFPQISQPLTQAQKQILIAELKLKLIDLIRQLILMLQEQVRNSN